MQRALDRKLTLDPITAKRVPLETNSEQRENLARHAREYAESTRELLDDPPDTAGAWLERVRFETTWMDTPEYRKARSRSVLISFVGIFVSLTGLYPAKIDALGLSFSPSTHAGFIVALVGLIWYTWASVMVLTRDYLIEATCIDLEHKILGRYRDYQNRWAYYIAWQHAEKAFFYKRLPSFIALFSVLCLCVSLLRSLFVRG